MHADGYCDDENNKEACFFDGGDCCGSDVNMEYCSECLCLGKINFGCTTLDCEISMKSYHGKYVQAELNGEANANSDTIGSWEIWTVTFIGSDQVQFQGAHGKYLVAEENGDANANRAAASIWETFTVVDMGSGKFAFKSFHGKYLVAEADGALNANRVVASTWETFEVVPEK